MLIYGLVGLKTHSKITHIVRSRKKTYLLLCNIGTGKL